MRTKKTAYFNALREAASELMNIATGREVRPPELDTMAELFGMDTPYPGEPRAGESLPAAWARTFQRAEKRLASAFEIASLTTG